MSSRQLLRKLQALTGERPNTLVRRMRLDRAAELLRTDGRSVKEAAYATGFRSTTHFSQAFREAFGLSPSEFATPQS